MLELLEYVGIPFTREMGNQMRSVVASYEAHEKRNPIIDAVHLTGILERHGYSFDFKPEFDPKKLDKDKPTVLVVNHYFRPLFQRRSPSTTADVLITSAAASVPFSQILEKPVAWMIQDDFQTDYHGIQDPARLAMLAAIYCYDYIGITKDKTNLSQLKELTSKCSELFNNGTNLALFPEGKVEDWKKPYKLSPPDKSFKGFVRRLNGKHPDLQLFPFTVCSENKNYTTIANNPISINGDAELAVNSAMKVISDNLPDGLK